MQTEYAALMTNVAWTLCLLHLMATLEDASMYLKLNTNLMASLDVSKHVLLLRASIKHRTLIILRFLAL